MILYYCIFYAFIDYKQTFDTVWRGSLLFKIYLSGITDKCLTFKKKNMYGGIKSKVILNDETSHFFFC